MAGLASLLVWPWLLQVAQAYSTFDSNCTLPDSRVNFVSSPPTRGTMDIVWSSLLALLSCTWAIQHMVVPRQKSEDEDKVKKGFASVLLLPYRCLRDFDWHKVRWMVMTVIMPEIVVAKSMAEYASATYWAKRFDEIAPRDQELSDQSTKQDLSEHQESRVRSDRRAPKWTKTHGFFADMRGLVLSFEVNAVPTDLTPKKPSKEAIDKGLHRPRADFLMPYEKQDAREAEAIEAEMCGIICGSPCSNINHGESSQKVESQEKNSVAETIAMRPRTAHSAFEKSSEDSNPSANYHAGTLGPHKPWRGTWALSAAQWFHAYEIGIIEQLPAVTKEEIDDRSKGDLFAKLAAVFQIVWLVISITARAFQNLDISLLEITVIAFSAVAIIIYLFFLEKPQGVGVPVYVEAATTLTREHVISLAARSPASTIIVHEFWLHGVAVRDQAENIHPSSPGLAVHLPFRKQPVYLSPLLGIGLGAILFGAIHFAAWDFVFPTSVEKLLWRISCVLCVALPPVGTVVYHLTLYFGKLGGSDDRNMNAWLKPMEYLLAPAYLLSRMYLTTEVFRQLAYLPPSAYSQVDWSIALPHVG